MRSTVNWLKPGWNFFPIDLLFKGTNVFMFELNLIIAYKWLILPCYSLLSPFCNFSQVGWYCTTLLWPCKLSTMRGKTSAWAVIQEAGARKRWKQEQKMIQFFIISVPLSTNTPWELCGQNLSDRLKIDVPSIMYCNSFYGSHLNYLIPCFLLLE